MKLSRLGFGRRPADPTAARVLLMEPGAARRLLLVSERERGRLDRRAPLDALEARRAREAKRPRPAALAAPDPGGVTIWAEAGALIVDRVAVFEVRGPLFPAGVVSGSGVVRAHGYDTLAEGVRLAQDDARVDACLLLFDSPGGVVDGIDDCAETLRASTARAGGKPLHVHVEGVCASAAYWLAAQADRITASRTSVLGSIGVYVLHWSLAGMLDKAGVEITAIESDPSKTAGAWWSALAEDARLEIQAEVDNVYEGFLAAVSAGRPTLTRKRLLEMRARLYHAEVHPRVARAYADRLGDLGALERGLIDGVAALDDAFAALRREARSRRPPTKRAPVARAVARRRNPAVTQLPEARGREKLARELARQGIATEAAREMLRAAPREYQGLAAFVVAERLRVAEETGEAPCFSAPDPQVAAFGGGNASASEDDRVLERMRAVGRRAGQRYKSDGR